MKTGLGEIVGRRISGVLVKDSPKEPRRQIFLLFEDGTLYELYGYIHVTGGVFEGGIDWVRQYLANPNRPLVFARVEDPKDQAALDREMAVARILVQLGSKTVSLDTLRSALESATKSGCDWHQLYEEAATRRPRDLGPAPDPESIWP